MSAKSSGVFLKPGRDKAIRNRHHWIFSGAVQSLPHFEDGDLLPVFASDGLQIGSGYFNRKSGIIGRMLSFDKTPPMEALDQLLKSALKLRQDSIDLSSTNGFRLVNAEGDGIPGLILDVYDKAVVLQSSTKGIDRIKPWIIDWINSHIKSETIYEKSVLQARREEGIPDVQGHLSGIEQDEIVFKENGLKFSTSLSKSQKTGFFLDHREMRQWIRQLSKDKRVLNAFSYTGGFSIYALAGGAIAADSMDISEEALEAAKHNFTLNGWNPNDHQFYCENVFTALRQKDLNYDIVILDPPAFAKKQKDIIPACRGYKDINRVAMHKMPPQSMLLTCSCSHFIDEELFQKVIFQAALEARRQVRILGRHRLAPDHPINIFHPEGNYLKSFLLFLE